MSRIKIIARWIYGTLIYPIVALFKSDSNAPGNQAHDGRDG